MVNRRVCLCVALAVQPTAAGRRDEKPERRGENE